MYRYMWPDDESSGSHNHVKWLASSLYVYIYIYIYHSTDCSTAGWTTIQKNRKTWRRHQMETFSMLLALCAGNSPATGEFLSQSPVTWSFDAFFDLRLNKGLRKQSWGGWYETPARSLWRHCNVQKFHDLTVERWILLTQSQWRWWQYWLDNIIGQHTELCVRVKNIKSTQTELWSIQTNSSMSICLWYSL